MSKMKISAPGENNDLIDIAQSYLEAKEPLRESTQAKLLYLRYQHKDSEELDVTENELTQLKNMLDVATEKWEFMSRVQKIDMIIKTLEEFIGHQQREKKLKKHTPAMKLEALNLLSEEIFRPEQLGSVKDSWIKGDKPFTFVLIPQIHSNPFTGESDPITDKIQRKEINIMLIALARTKVCNIVGGEGNVLEDGPISEFSLLTGDILANSSSGVHLAEFASPDIDTFGIEDAGYHENKDLDDMKSHNELLTFFTSPDGDKALQGFLNKTEPVSFDDIMNLIKVPEEKRERFRRYLERNGDKEPVAFVPFLYKLLENQESLGEEFADKAIKRNVSIVQNLVTIQDNTDTSCVSLVLGADHFNKNDKPGQESIQRILREKEISYITLVPESVGMEGYDFVDKK